jgi:hypothetical protein
LSRFTDVQLRTKALAVLEDALARASKATLADEAALSFTLAWLANRHDERWPFDQFWRSRLSEDNGRWQNMNAALNGIYRVVGVRRL